MNDYSKNCGGKCDKCGYEQTRLWGRSQGNACIINVPSQVLDMRRKSETLKYNNNSSKLTKKQQYANVIGRTSNINRKYYGNFIERNNTLTCPKGIQKTYPSSASNVPGNKLLYYNKNDPLTRWITQRQYKSGSEKLPQYSSGTNYKILCNECLDDTENAINDGGNTNDGDADDGDADDGGHDGSGGGGQNYTGTDYINFRIKNDSDIDASLVFISIKNSINIYDLVTSVTSWNLIDAPGETENKKKEIGISLNDLDTEPSGNIYSFKIPRTLSGKVLISYKNKLEFTYNSSNVWADPPYIIADTNETVFGFIEYSLKNDNDKVLFANVSAVDNFGMPLYLTMYDASNNLEPQTNSGLYIPRTYIIQHADKRFKEWKEPFDTSWNLFNDNDDDDFGKVSRILSSKIYASSGGNDKKLLTDDWLDFCIDKQFDVRCDNTNLDNYIYPSIWSCVVKITEGIYKLHIKFKESIDWQALTPPENTPAINTTLYHDNNNESKEYTCIIDNSFNSAFKLFGGNNFPISKVEPQDLTDSSWNNSWPDAPINQCWKAISQNIQINYFPPRDRTNPISASNDIYYKDISNNYYSKYDDMSGVDTQTFDLYSRTIHECVGETEVYTYAYDEPMFPSVLGNVVNWTNDHHMSLYLGYAKHIDNISDTSLYDEVNSKLNNDDKLQPITSDTYHAPKFTGLQEKIGDFSKFYKYFKKPEPF